ncbi:MAG: ATP-binding protein, partial [Chloroflexota bacterium]|nr:ATP-binding protein [Chloroflexota bacterium]
RDELEASEGISVFMALSENLPPVKTSPDMLTEAFRVLIKNSVEALQEKGEGGELRIENRLSGSSVVEVSISDSGLGIRPEDISKVFELQWSTKEMGMGFGLFWTKEYIEGLGGNIKVKSVWREGTTFQVRLPSSVK